MKKLTAMILVLALSLGLVLPASAEQTEQTAQISAVEQTEQTAQVPAVEQTYNKVFFLGDSNGMGYGLEGYMDYLSKDFVSGLEGSFPRLVSDALEAKCVNMSFPALRAKDALIHLGGEPYAFSERDQAHQDHYTTNQIPMAEEILPEGGYKTELQDADLVVIELGCADLLFCTLTMAWKYGQDDVAALVSTFLEEMYTNYQEFQQEYPRLLEQIRALNDKCEIVIVGTWNPAKDLTYNDDIAIPLLEGVAWITMNMNRDYQNWAKEYGAIYAGVSNTETGTLGKGVTVESLLDETFVFNDVFHASPSGHQYIARQILNALKEKQITTDISIDLGSAKSIMAVTLGSTLVTDYTFDPATCTLTIPNKSLLQSVVTVTYRGPDKADGSEGDICFATYQLSWKMGTGYVAYRLYTTKNVVATVTSTSKLLRNSLTAVVTKIKELFQK